MADSHPFRRTPYAYRSSPPGYVGPRWAAPGPPKRLAPKKRRGWGCLFRSLIPGVGVLVLSYDFLHDELPTPPTPQSADVRPSALDDAPTPPGLVGIPPRTPVDPERRLDQSTGSVWAASRCRDLPLPAGDIELRQEYDLSYRGRGSARRLRGRVALVHLRLMSPKLQWTIQRVGDVDRSALLTSDFLETRAWASHVQDLEIVSFAWSLATTLELPQVIVDSKGRPTPPSARELVRQSLRASEASLGATMRQLTAILRKEGHDEIAFLLHLPLPTEARDFAYPAVDGEPDVAVVFALQDLDSMAPASAHEALHLFGADDLYNLTVFDDRDSRDVMRAACRGFGGFEIREMTAYAVGWRNAKPARAYPTDP